MQNNDDQKKLIKMFAGLFEGLVLLYFASYLYWMFGAEGSVYDQLSTLFVKLNPMTIGTYLLGLTVLIHLIVFKNPIILGILCAAYLFSVTVSFITIMGMTRWGDFLIYLPHIFILIATIFVLKRKSKWAKA